MLKYFDAVTLGYAGSWASLAGLAVTLLTLSMLLRIKRKFLFRVSIDEHIKEINRLTSDISVLLGSYLDNRYDIEELFALAEVELRAMQKGATDDLLSEIKRSRSLIRNYNSKICFWIEKDEKSAREIKTKLSVVSAELGKHRKALLVGK